jgi:hypothetical protein
VASTCSLPPLGRKPDSPQNARQQGAIFTGTQPGDHHRAGLQPAAASNGRSTHSIEHIRNISISFASGLHICPQGLKIS